MTAVRLQGSLSCADEAEAGIVLAHLSAHVLATRAEPGCVRFEVVRTDDPLVWHVSEEFDSPEAFRSHRAAAAGSEWGVATAGIGRDYVVDGLRPAPAVTP